jgi:hypothetical protein
MKKSLMNILLMCGAVFLFFVFFETALAVFWPHKIMARPYHEQYHPVMGWINKPNVDGKVRVTRDVFFNRRHNSHGLRSLREIIHEKSPGVKRILLIGDSFFWGYGVDDRDVVSEILQQRVGPGIEIINGSVTGYGTDQELLWLAEEGLKYQPDIVILGFFPTNDLDEISTSLSYGYPKPYFSFDGDSLVVRNIPVPDTRETRRKAFDEPDTVFGKLKKFLRHTTHTYPFIVGRLNSISALRDFFLKTGLAEEYTRVLPGIAEVRLNPERIQNLSDALIKEARRISAGAGADFLLVFIPKKEETPNNSLGYEGVDADARDWNSKVSAYLSGFTKQNDMNYLDLLPRVREIHAKGENLYTGKQYDHHWTPRGHAMAGIALYDWLMRNGYATPTAR